MFSLIIWIWIRHSWRKYCKKISVIISNYLLHGQNINNKNIFLPGWCGQKSSVLRKLWQYGLWSFQIGYVKLEIFLHKNQHTQRNFLSFGLMGSLSSLQKSDFLKLHISVFYYWNHWHKMSEKNTHIYIFLLLVQK